MLVKIYFIKLELVISLEHKKPTTETMQPKTTKKKTTTKMSFSNYITYHLIAVYSISVLLTYLK